MSKKLSVYSNRLLVRIFLSRFDFLIPALGLLIVQVPYWTSSFWPEHYTLVTFMNFYSFYNEFFIHNDLLRWMPFGSYGIQANFWQLHQLTPISYLVIFLGKIVQFRDVLLLFKLNVFFESLVFLTGTYLLTKRIYSNALSVCFVCVGVSMSVIWTYEICWNLRIVYLLPIVFYFLIQFLELKEARYFWWSALVLSISMIGNLPYFSPLHLLICGIFLGVMLMGKCVPTTSWIPKTRQELAWFFVFFILFGVVIVFTVHCLDWIMVFKTGRDPNLFFVTELQHFVIHCKATWHDYFEFILPAFGRNHDNAKYIGYLPILFALYALVVLRNRTVYAFFAIIIFLCVFSVGDSTPLARWVYETYPPIRIFRYVGQVGVIVKFCLLVIGGFGFDAVVNSSKCQRFYWVSGGFISALTLVYCLNGNARWFASDWPLYLFEGICVLASVLIVSVFLKRPTQFACLMIAVAFVDLLAFQRLSLAKAFENQVHPPEALRRVDNYSFQMARLSAPNKEMPLRIQAGVDYIDSIKGLWVEGYDFIKYDPCIPFRPAIYEARPVFDLVKELFEMEFPLGNYLSNLSHFTNHSKLRPFLSALGCYDSKLKISSDVDFARDLEEVKLKLQASSNFNSRFVVLDPSLPKINAENADHEPGKVIRVLNFSANRLEVEVETGAQKEAWLYYADSYHPGWHASVDGANVPIERANLAFKAVRLSPGIHRVLFTFFDGWNSVSALLIAFFGLISSGFGVLWAFKMLRKELG